MVPADASIEEKEKEKYQDLRRQVARVMACKCYCNACSGWGFGYGDKEPTKESSANRSVCKNRIPTESSIAWNRKNFAKSSSGLRLQVVACPQLKNDQ